MAAEDLVQEALISALLHPPPKESLAWYARVMRNRHIDDHRSADAMGRAIRMDGADVIDPRDDALADLTPAIDLLDPHHRDVCRLTYIYGYTDSETARLLGIARGTVKSRLYRAREALREIVHSA